MVPQGKILHVVQNSPQRGAMGCFMSSNRITVGYDIILNMKNWTLIPLAAMVGFMAGSWGPREDLKNYKLNSQEARIAKQTSDTSGFGAFAKMVNIPEVAQKPRRMSQPVPKVPALTDTNDVEIASNTNRMDRPRMQWRHMSREDLRARIDEASDLWQTRVELAKTQWKTKLGIADDESVSAFESAFAHMNEILRDTMVALAEEVENAGKMTPELGLRLMGDASVAMAGAYDALGAAVPPEKRAEVSQIPVFEFIDPMVAEPLIGVQDKLDQGFRDLRK